MSNVVKSFALGWAAVIALCWPLSTLASPFTSQPVYTAKWQPYVNKADAELGSTAHLVQLVFFEMGLEPEWNYLDYYFSLKLLKQGKIPASFPYFKTPEREQQVLFSDALMQVENGVFYSNRWNQIDPQQLDMKILKVGRVAGYSYGKTLAFMLPKATVYGSELLALQALAEGEIDLLPISIEVARNMVQHYLPHRVHEFSLLDEYRSKDDVHLIAPRNESGAVFIRQFNQAFARLKQAGLIDAALRSDIKVRGSGYVRLVPAEGFPVLTGYEVLSDKTKRYFVIPHGSRATVLHWHDVVIKPHKNERIFDGMMRYSQVKIVDGPHAGRTLFVRNMHIEVE